MMSRVGRTLTDVLTIEARQHELLGMELGEGPTRKTIKIGALIGGAWLLIAVPVSIWLGLWSSIDMAPFGFACVVIPPAILVAFGLRPQEEIPKRITLTRVALRIRYATRSHLPLIRLGARKPSRGERLPVTARVGYLLPHSKDNPLPLVGNTQPSVGFDWKARMYGRDYQRILAAWMNRKARK